MRLPTMYNFWMRAGVVWWLALLVLGCKKTPTPDAFGRFVDLAARAKQLGCDFKDTDESLLGDHSPLTTAPTTWVKKMSCSVVVGPCGCALDVSAKGDLSDAADGTTRGISELEINMDGCPPGRGFEPLAKLLEPLFSDDELPLLRELFTPPKDNAAIHRARNIGRASIGAWWIPIRWADAPTTRQRAHIYIVPTYGHDAPEVAEPNPDEVWKRPGKGPGSCAE
jgi:hypothetical protein